MRTKSILTAIMLAAFSSKAFGWSGVIARNNTCDKTFYFTVQSTASGFQSTCDSGWIISNGAVINSNYATLPPGGSITCDSFSPANYGGRMCFQPESDPPQTMSCPQTKYPIFEAGAGATFGNPDITLLPNNCDNSFHSTPTPEVGWLPAKLEKHQVPRGLYCKGAAGNGKNGTCPPTQQASDCPAMTGQPASCQTASPVTWSALGAGLEISCGKTYPQPENFPMRCQGKGSLKNGYPEDCGYIAQKDNTPAPFPMNNRIGTKNRCYNGDVRNNTQAFFWPMFTGSPNQNYCPASNKILQPNPGCSNQHLVLDVIPQSRTDPEQLINQNSPCPKQTNTCPNAPGVQSR